ncbi:recombinase family protein [Lactococcus lactis]|uniref:Site-specific recombinases, DNA invertase Pin homologs n=1 Tax=Lactococcus lactis subsp. lactis A12 TaxID=1137134 RepID=S6FRN1_LACLL|nr:recombinase family protein [Lactococcus lactis]CDG03727.1 Site-specific recombinases, DNA invertase Pin homologs [Lactococcus lactis subsp. lactis A12]SBW29620.1 Site-specific recombinases, DNA invertase Pin homologs [Lactococcus lactis subsp. lactis]
MNRSLKIEYSEITDEKNLTVLYARLSKDDGKSGDSDSILNQKLLLENFAREQKLAPYVFLADDGVSGTTFNRPAFQQAIELVNRGQVKTFVVKDLSRFGRDYLKVGAFTEVAFPEKGVRFIAINDNVDSDRPDDNSLAPFRNLFNEWYARDCSKKIKAVKHSKGNAGIPMTANVPYGYLKGENYKETHEWIVDEEAAIVIRRIFHDYASGKSMTMIAKELETERVNTPAAHKVSIGLKSNKMPSFRYGWNAQTIRQVLAHREYCGHTVNFKTYKKSYKTKKHLPTPLEEQKIFKNTHEAIIDEDLFELVQEKRGAYRPRRTMHHHVGLFSGITCCMDCGSLHHYDHNGGDCSPFYYCSGASKRIKICKSRHSIMEKRLEPIVLEDVRRITQLVKNNESELVTFLEKKFRAQKSRTFQKDKQMLEKAKHRFLELDQIIQHLYEDNLSGKLSDARYAKMSQNYEQEQEKLGKDLACLEQRVAEVEDVTSDINRFIQVAKKYLEPDQLEADMVRELIEKIEIGEKGRVDGKNEQKIRIIYRFVGEIDEKNGLI